MDKRHSDAVRAISDWQRINGVSDDELWTMFVMGVGAFQAMEDVVVPVTIRLNSSQSFE